VLLPIGLLWILTVLPKLKNTKCAKHTQSYKSQDEFKKERQDDNYASVLGSDGSLIKSDFHMIDTKIKGNQTHNTRDNSQYKPKVFHITHIIKKAKS
jgi:hypothetical protein